MSGEQQKDEAISRAARSEASARRRLQGYLVCSNQMPRQRDRQRDEKTSWCHLDTVRRHQSPTVRGKWMLTTSNR